MIKKEGTEKLLTPEEVIRQADLEERIEIIEEVKYADDRKNGSSEKLGGSDF